MSVAALARQRVHRMKRGIPFSISGFYSLGKPRIGTTGNESSGQRRPAGPG
jgi:hypothetical protein